jgi:hypothetical protein
MKVDIDIFKVKAPSELSTIEKERLLLTKGSHLGKQLPLDHMKTLVQWFPLKALLATQSCCASETMKKVMRVMTKQWVNAVKRLRS